MGHSCVLPRFWLRIDQSCRALQVVWRTPSFWDWVRLSFLRCDFCSTWDVRFPSFLLYTIAWKEFEKLVLSFCKYGEYELSRSSELNAKMRRVNNTQFRRPLIPGQRIAQWLAHRPVTKWTQVRIWVVAALDESWLWGPMKDRKAILTMSITLKVRTL